MREFHRRVEEALGQVVQVILFGSSARGDANEDSDVDVLVIAPVLDARAEEIIGDLAWEVGYEAGIVLSVIPVSQEQLHLLQYSPLFQSVQREGILL